MGVRFQLLGDLGGVALGSGRLRVLLATLLLRANQTVSVDELVDRLWDAGAPPGARTTVQTYVMRLRRALGDPTGQLVRTRPGGYVITIAPDQLDLLEFRDLVETAARQEPATAATTLRGALALWRGPALADVPSELLRQRDVPLLEEERLQALERRIELDLELGRHAEVVGELAGLTASHPYRERFRHQHMVSLFRGGRQAEALASYREIHARLAEDLGVVPGPELRELHEAILRNETTAPRPAPAPTPAPTVAPVPRQLPAAATAFTGRADDLAVLGGLATSIVVIHGTAGIGKTSLAVYWSHQVADRFPDGQLYLDLRGFDLDQAPMDPGDALGRMLRALGVEAGRIPVDTDERTGMFRSTVAERSVLVLLDNAATVDQVRPLLAGSSTCLTMVTSRNQLAGLVAVDGAGLLPLDVLSRADSVRLLTALLGPERVSDSPADTEELARLCGDLPLALRLAAGNLLVRPKNSIASAVTDLRRGSRLAALAVPGDSRAAVRPAFELSYRALRPAEQELFRWLGLVPGPDFTVEAAAALLGRSTEDTSDLVAGLVAVSLAESHAHDRYRMHDLLRLYARDLCAEHDTSLPLRRLADWYVSRAESVADLLYPESRLLQGPAGEPWPDGTDAWDWLEAELPNLVAVTEAAADWGMPAVAWRLTDALRGFFLARTQHLDAWHTTARAGVAAADSAGDDRIRAAMLITLGTVHWGLCDMGAYLDQTLAAAALAEQAGWTFGHAVALGNGGHACLGMGRLAQGVELMEQALEMRREQGDTPARLAAVLRITGQIHAHLGNLPTALEHFREALRLARELGAALNEMDALGGLSWVHWQLGDTVEAESVITEMLTLTRRHDAQYRESVCLRHLADFSSTWAGAPKPASWPGKRSNWPGPPAAATPRWTSSTPPAGYPAHWETPTRPGNTTRTPTTSPTANPYAWGPSNP
ncbi:BTAD domain-containing putative transcriptional regulator [Kibdelosporangium lantanae]